MKRGRGRERKERKEEGWGGKKEGFLLKPSQYFAKTVPLNSN